MSKRKSVPGRIRLYKIRCIPNNSCTKYTKPTAVNSISQKNIALMKSLKS